MKYSVATVSALAVAVIARPEFTNSAIDVQAGQPFKLEFTGCEGGCTIALKKGDSLNLAPVATLTTAATGTSFTANLPAGLPKDDYAFYIKNNEDGTDNYSKQFAYGSGSASASAPATASASESTSAASSTEASSTETASATETKTKTTASATETTATEASTTESKSTTAAATTSAARSTSHSSNKTSSSAPAATTTGKSVPDSAAVRLASPIALVAGAIAAMVYLS